ncbi:hypothetical protein CKK33_04730 [Mucilaginibacter sp. MD40]|uniref:MAC/perforin domain-containing protein n=1 Tax=Mucilaginibacter sp. MD40 TaxID=2029590 RepID=UPI000BACA705|nr:MAC/perforin domain-containing protein [Mucilaginibacter sp. MD40]PAW92835.1 hypothetical protein CKK33_04730 [Mucilaginibacter sp. MD40]
MKKVLLIIPLIGMLWSCKKNDQLSKSISITKQPRLETKAARDGVYDVLGYGYNVGGSSPYAVTSATTLPVINVAAFVAAQPTLYTYNQNTVNSTKFAYGENAESYSKKFTANLNVTGGFALFKGNLTSSYSSSDAWNSKYMYGSFEQIVQEKNLRMTNDPSILRNYLSPGFVSAIANSTPQSIIENFGPYVLTNINLGAKLVVMYQGQTTADNRSETVAASLNVSVSSFISVDAKITNDNTASKNASNTYLHYASYGGDPTKSLTPTTISWSPSTAPLDYGNWINSVTPANAEFIGIGDNGLVAIWDLIADPAKAQAVHDYYTNVYVPANQVSTIWQTATLYRCLNTSTGDYLLTTSPSEVSGQSNWRVEGALGKVFVDEGHPNTAQFFRWFLKNGGTHFFTADPNEIPSNATFEGRCGYITTTATAGYNAIYRYSKKTGNGAHFYSNSYNELGAGNGTWKYDGIAGYLQPAN